LIATMEGPGLLLDAVEHDVQANRALVLALTESVGSAAVTESARFSWFRQEDAEFLMLRYRPQLTAAPERQRRDWVFLFESSGDRDPLLARTQVEIIRGLLAPAEPEDTFAAV